MQRAVRDVDAFGLRMRGTLRRPAPSHAPLASILGIVRYGLVLTSLPSGFINVAQDGGGWFLTGVSNPFLHGFNGIRALVIVALTFVILEAKSIIKALRTWFALVLGGLIALIILIALVGFAAALALLLFALTLLFKPFVLSFALSSVRGIIVPVGEGSFLHVRLHDRVMLGVRLSPSVLGSV